MVDTSVARTALGASTLIRKWYLDVDTSSTNTPSWVAVNGLGSFKPAVNPTLKDDSDFSGGGRGSKTKTADAWSLEFKVMRKPTLASATAYDPGQELLRLRGDAMGTANTVHVRWYEMTPGGPKVEAYEGYAAVSWSPDGGSYDDTDVVSVTLDGQGPKTAVTHPAA